MGPFHQDLYLNYCTAISEEIAVSKEDRSFEENWLTVAAKQYVELSLSILLTNMSTDF